jgi:predicted benzoate:H+ symporter BenE
LHTATSVAAINGVLAGLLVGFAMHLMAPIPLPALAVVASLVAIGMFGGLLLDQERRWRQSDQAEPTMFLPDGAPAMTFHGFAGSAPMAGRARAAVADKRA